MNKRQRPMQDSESSESMEEPGQETEPQATKRPRYGFNPMETEEDLNAQEQVKIDPRIQEFKEKINKLCCRYPKMKPRTSHALMEQLSFLSLQELENVYMNMINDLSDIRGTPSAETVLLVTKAIDPWVPHYSEVCLKDVELKRDVETEMMEIFGWFGNRINILFRLINNIYIASNFKMYADEELQVTEVVEDESVRPLPVGQQPSSTVSNQERHGSSYPRGG